MTFKEKMLYQQIHPLKLLVDFSTGFYTTWLLWQHNIVMFLLLFILPSVLVTIALVKLAGLEKLKASSFGQYVKDYMTFAIEMIRFSGQIMMWVGGWYHLPVLIPAGLLVIVGGWCGGLVFKRQHHQ